MNMGPGTKRMAGVLAAAVWVLFACLDGRGADKPNLLLVTIDTLRPDRLSCYGSPYVKTPNIDAVAGGGALFSRAFAHNPMTLPSHVNIMLGATPLFHGIHENVSCRVPPDFLTLAEHLKSAGYATAAFVGAFSLDSRFGLDQGFDVYDDHYPAQPGRNLLYPERRAEEVVARALDWIKARTSPWFAFVHVWDPHAPYRPPEPFAGRFKQDPYSGEVAYADSELGKLFGALAGNEKMFMVITGDHGESLGEHGESAHGYFAYNSTLWVPLLISGPGIGSQKIQDNVSHIDIFPTICELLNVKKPQHLQGRSLVPVMKKKKMPGKPVYFESMEPYLHRGWAPLRGFIEGSMKYFDSPLPEFYDLEKDFGEADNLASKTDLTGYLAKLRAMERDLSSGNAARISATTDRDTREKLHSLGYVAASVVQVKDQYGPEDDLKTLHPYEQKFDRALVLDSEGKTDESIRLLREIVNERRDFGKAYTQIAFIYKEHGNLREAAKIMAEAYANNPDSYYVSTVYGYHLARVGATDKAIAILEKTLSVFDQNPEVWNHLSVCYWRKGDLAKALEYGIRALALDRTDPLIYNDLGTVYLSMHLKDKLQDSLSKSLESFQRAVELDPGLASAHNGLGGALKISGRVDEAVASWEKALELDPKLGYTLYNLGLTHLQQGRKEKALEYLERYLVMSKNELPPKERQEVETLIQKCKEKVP